MRSSVKLLIQRILCHDSYGATISRSSYLYLQLSCKVFREIRSNLHRFLITVKHLILFYIWKTRIDIVEPISFEVIFHDFPYLSPLSLSSLTLSLSQAYSQLIGSDGCIRNSIYQKSVSNTHTWPKAAKHSTYRRQEMLSRARFCAKFGSFWNFQSEMHLFHQRRFGAIFSKGRFHRSRFGHCSSLKRLEFDRSNHLANDSFVLSMQRTLRIAKRAETFRNFLNSINF